MHIAILRYWNMTKLRRKNLSTHKFINKQLTVNYLKTQFNSLA